MRPPHQNHLLVLSYLSFLVIIFPLYICVADSSPSKYCKVELVEQKIKLDVRGETLENVLLAIHKQTGIEFFLGNEHAEKLVTRSVEPLAMGAFLRRIFSDYNYVVTYDVNKRPIKVKIFNTASDYAYSNINENPEHVSSPKNTGSKPQKYTKNRKETKSPPVASDMNKGENSSIDSDEAVDGEIFVEAVEVQPPSESYEQMITQAQATGVPLHSAIESFEQMIINAPVTSVEKQPSTPRPGIIFQPASESYKQMIIASPAKNSE
jgi:hypothetical protein